MIDKNDPKLTAYLFNELSPEETAEVEKALADSEELRQELEALRATSNLLAAEFGNGSELGIGAERKSAIESALNDPAEVAGTSSDDAEVETEYVVSKSVPRPAGRSQWWWIAAVSAAIVVVSVPLLTDFQQQMSDMAKYVPTSEEWDGGSGSADEKADPVDETAAVEDLERLEAASRVAKSSQESELGSQLGTPESRESLNERADDRLAVEEEPSGALGREGNSLSLGGVDAKSKAELVDSMSSVLNDKHAEVDLLRDEIEKIKQQSRERSGQRMLRQQPAAENASRPGSESTNVAPAESSADRSSRQAPPRSGDQLAMGGGGGGGLGGMGGGAGGMEQAGGGAGRSVRSSGQNSLGLPAADAEASSRQLSIERQKYLDEMRRLEELRLQKVPGFLDALSDGVAEKSGRFENGLNGQQPGESKEAIRLANNREVEEFSIPPSTSPGQTGGQTERHSRGRSRGRGGQRAAAREIRSRSKRSQLGEEVAGRENESAQQSKSGQGSDGQDADSGKSNRSAGEVDRMSSSTVAEAGDNKQGEADEGRERVRIAGMKTEPSDQSQGDNAKRDKAAEGSKYDFKTETLVRPVQRMRTESRSRVIQTDEGPKEEVYTVEVPIVEQEQLKLLKVQDNVAAEMVQSLGQKIDPSGTKEIRIPDLQQFETKLKGKSDQADIGLQFGLLVNQEIQKEASSLKLSKLEQAQSRRQVWRAVQQKLAERNQSIRAKRTWKRVRATPNTSRLMVGDKDELSMNGMQVNVHVEGFRARVLIDCLYYNDRGRQLEGNFKIRLPDDASLYYFAFGQSRYQYRPNLAPTPKDIADNEFNRGQRISFAPEEIRAARRENWSQVKESRMVTKEKAAFAYSQTVRRRIDPALVEWTGGGIFNARVFPLMPQKMHRIVLGYDVDLKREGDNWSFDLDLPEERGVCQVNIHVADQPGVKLETVPTIDPVVSNYVPLSSDEQRQVDNLETELNQKVGNLGKSHPQVLELSRKLEELRTKFAKREGGDRVWKTFTITNPEVDAIGLDVLQPQRTVLRSSSENSQQFFAFRAPVKVPESAQKAGSQRAVFLLDTSLSSQPDKFNVWLKMLEATLSNNRDSIKEFAVMYFSVDQHFWRKEYSENTNENVKALLGDCQELALEGATDLYSAFQRLQVTEWVASGDGGGPILFLLSDGNANWGESNIRMLSQLVRDSKLGNVFAYQTGMSGTAIGSLRFLANETGGALFSVTSEQEIAAASTAFRSRPWRVESLTVDNGYDVLSAGRLQWLYPGQMLTVAGRISDTEKPLGAISIELSQGDDKRTIKLNPESELPSELADRVYGQIAVEQLESLGETLVDVSAAYARNFRVTGETCSLLMLESEADYRRFNIVPKDDQIVVATRKADDLIRDVLAKNAAELASPTSQLRAWVQRLEKMEGMQFEMPTALKLLMDEIELEAVTGTLNTTYRIAELDTSYLEKIKNGSVDYAAATREAKRRLAKSSDDAVKAVSSLVEANPGNLVLARDVAFSALEWKHPAPAFHLLRRVAESRPYEASVYPAIGNCLAELGELDAAMIFFEIALETKFRNSSPSYQRIVAVDYTSLLRKVVKSELAQGLKQYADIRLKAINQKFGLKKADVVVTMMWNTDQTDVDLHVIEPSGEECFYQHKRTRSGGTITEDVTTGFGPEMFVLPDAPVGRYQVLAKYFGDNSNRTKQRGKVYINLIRNYGSENQTQETRTVLIQNVGEKNKVLEFEVD